MKHLLFGALALSGIVTCGSAAAKPKTAVPARADVAAAGTASAATDLTAPGPAGERMNIILFLVDDLGYGDLGFAGNTQVESPNIDRFVGASTRFTAAYAAPESSPTRAGILTGKNPASLHITTWIPQSKDVGGSNKSNIYKGWLMPDEADGVPMSEYLLSQALLAGGYDTWHIGKWHIGAAAGPKQRGFLTEIGYWPWAFPKNYFSPYGLETLKDGPKGEYLTDRLTTEAVNLINNHGKKPFFLNFWHYAVHEPLNAPQDEIDYYAHKGNPATGVNNALYSAMKGSVDRSFGRVLQALKDNDLEQNTIVIFYSDNGGVVKHARNYPMRDGKKSLYEGGIRVPLAIRDPRYNASPRTIDTPVSYIDFYPTILEMAGIDPKTVKQKLDGQSFMPLIEGRTMDGRTFFWHEMGAFGHGPASAMRQGNYKLMKFWCRPQGQQFELYDLSKDISETNDLSAQLPDVVAQMNKAIDAWVKQSGAQLPIRQQQPDKGGRK